ncbi:hypothetical protein NX02_28455 [Sphingomonas sanxanigenens DSM 19645 = NX02]|uniref:Uncharacterized protein n=1 Tax=Sphingomonas sanxanigenens DSM 19645 = NX02 TaxID=1123269 RepID=W0AL10_9SPHN|nr:hypothetical protein NX02_28455 [Sphingomonas sanxanigenens DSM 19645 = NX02]
MAHMLINAVIVLPCAYGERVDGAWGTTFPA